MKTRKKVKEGSASVVDCKSMDISGKEWAVWVLAVSDIISDYPSMIVNFDLNNPVYVAGLACHGVYLGVRGYLSSRRARSDVFDWPLCWQ